MMRILVISEHLPGPSDQHGLFQRLGMFAEALGRMGQLEFLFFVGPHKKTDAGEIANQLASRWHLDSPKVTIERYGDEPGSSQLVRDYLLPATSIHRQAPFGRMSSEAQVNAVEKQLAGKPDMIFAHRLGSMCPLMLSRQQLPPILFDLDDIEHIATGRSISKPPLWLMKRLQYLQLPALWLGERRAVQRASATLVCSQRDRAYLEKTMAIKNIELLPNTGQESLPISPPSTAPANILFLGSYNYPPNALAAEILIKQIWPVISKALPEARLIIAGAQPEKIACYTEALQGVVFSGFVENLSTLYANTRVVCTPIQNGGGTRIKIIEAASHGRPVISTSIGAEGLEFVPGEEILIEDDLMQMAKQCVELLSNTERCDQIGQRAKDRAKALYDREGVIESIIAVTKKVLEENRAC